MPPVNDKPMALEIVDWLDSRSDDGWTEQDSLDMRVAKITTLGHVAQETDDVLCIASSRDEHTGQLSGMMFIPKQCILMRLSIDAVWGGAGHATDDEVLINALARWSGA